MPHAHPQATRCFSVALLALAITFQVIAPAFAQSGGGRPAPAVTYIEVDTRVRISGPR